MASLIDKHPLTRSGIFFSAAFILAILLNVFVFLMIGQGVSFLKAIANPTVVSLYVCVALLVLSTVKRRFSFIQPLLLLFVSSFTMVPRPNSIYGIGLFISGVILLYKGGYLERRRLIKLSLLGLYLYAMLFYAAFGKGFYSTYAIGPLFFTTAFLAFLYLIFKEQVVVYLKEKKPVLSLRERGLSEAESAYVRAVARGLSPKEMAVEFGVSESTIRNTMSRAYKKLGVADKADLAAMLASHELEPEAARPPGLDAAARASPAGAAERTTA